MAAAPGEMEIRREVVGQGAVPANAHADEPLVVHEEDDEMPQLEVASTASDGDIPNPDDIESEEEQEQPVLNRAGRGIRQCDMDTGGHMQLFPHPNHRHTKKYNKHRTNRCGKQEWEKRLRTYWKKKCLT